MRDIDLETVQTCFIFCSPCNSSIILQAFTQWPGDTGIRLVSCPCISDKCCPARLWSSHGGICRGKSKSNLAVGGERPKSIQMVSTLCAETRRQRRGRSEGEQLWKAIKAIVFCDLKEEGLIEKGYEGLYDIISMNGCLGPGCESLEHCIKAVRKLLSFLKAGGRIVITDVDYKPDILGKHFCWDRACSSFISHLLETS